MLFYTDRAITVKFVAENIVAGTSITYNVEFGSSRTTLGAQIYTADRTCTSEAGTKVEAFNDATIPAESFVVVTSSTIVGTLTEFALTLEYTED